MSGFLYEALTVTGGASGVVALVVTWVVLKVVAQEKAQRAEDAADRAELRASVKRLETERLAGLETKIDTHVSADRSQEILTKLEGVTGAICKMTDNVMRSLELNARQDQHLVAHDCYLANIDKVLQAHINQPHPKR